MMTTSNLMNPSESKTQRQFTLRHLAIVFEVLALLVTGYLTYSRFTNVATACLSGGVFNCEVVTNSVYSTIIGIPVAYLGFGLHIVIFSILLLQPRVSFLKEYGSLLIFGLGLFGFMFHCYLTFASVVWIQALCPWCLSAHTLMGLGLGTSIVRVYRQFFTAQPA